MPKKDDSSRSFDDYEGFLDPHSGDIGDEPDDEFDFAFYEQYVVKNAVKHHVVSEEIRQVFVNSPLRVFANKGKVPGEDMYCAYGCTDAGRYLLVVFIWKQDGLILPVSARDMKEKEKRFYARKR